jgi:hypothetical protein
MDDSDKIENLRRENEALKRELKETTLQLAALAHKEYQVPDGSIRDDYEKICRAIESWIDYACSDQLGEFKYRYREALKIEDKTHRLRFIGLEFERPATSDLTLDWLKKQDMLHYYILSLTIGRYIFLEILMKPYPVGTTQSQEIAFSSIEEEMLKMGKGISLVFITAIYVDMLTGVLVRSKVEEKPMEIRHIDSALCLQVFRNRAPVSTLSFVGRAEGRFVILAEEQ